MSYVDEHMGELIDRYAAEDGCDAGEWINRSIRAVVRHRYELDVTLLEAAAAVAERRAVPASEQEAAP